MLGARMSPSAQRARHAQLSPSALIEVVRTTENRRSLIPAAASPSVLNQNADIGILPASCGLLT